MLHIVSMCYSTCVHVEITGYCLSFIEIIKNWYIRAMYWKIFMECDSNAFNTVYMMQGSICSKLVSPLCLFTLHLRRWEKLKSDVKLAELSSHINTWWIRL